MRPEHPRENDTNAPSSGREDDNPRGSRPDARADSGMDADVSAAAATRRTAPWAGLVLVVLGTIGVVLLAQTFNPIRGLGRVDIPTIEWFADHRIDAVSDIMQVITMAFGKVAMPIIVIVLCAAWWAWTRRLREPLILIVAMALSTGISLWIKTAVGRPRSPSEFLAFPGLEKSMSFPSGHVIGAATLMLVGGYLIWRLTGTRRSLVLWLILSLAVPVIVAASRMYLGHHFPTDVMGGACVAVIVLGIVMIFDSLRPDVESRHSDTVVNGVSRLSRP